MEYMELHKGTLFNRYFKKLCTRELQWIQALLIVG